MQTVFEAAGGNVTARHGSGRKCSAPVSTCVFLRIDQQTLPIPMQRRGMREYAARRGMPAKRLESSAGRNGLPLLSRVRHLLDLEQLRPVLPRHKQAVSLGIVA